MMLELSTGENSTFVRNRKSSSNKIDQRSKIDISIPGVNRLFDRSAGKPAKIIWLVTIIFCAIVCACLTVHQLKEYFKYPTGSKTVIERRQTVQFPSISICTIEATECYQTELKKEIKSRCREKNVTNCEISKMSLRQLEINLQNVWDKCHFISIDVKFLTADLLKQTNDTNYEIVRRHTVLGSCTTVTHTTTVPYISAMTMLKIDITSKRGLKMLHFIPHEQQEFGTMGQELINQEMETLLVGYITQFKLREEIFNLENYVGRECYDQDAETIKSTRSILKYLSDVKSKICRLPFLPNDFPECESLDHFQTSLQEFIIMTFPLNNPMIGKRMCTQTLYGISTDYVLSRLLDSSDDAVNATSTTMVVKFADDTRIVITEYFSYTFPALVSDLFAYWGFFLSLSALVFAEIIEICILKICRSFKQCNELRK